MVQPILIGRARIILLHLHRMGDYTYRNPAYFVNALLVGCSTDRFETDLVGEEAFPEELLLM